MLLKNADPGLDRQSSIVPIELKTLSDDGEFEGYASVFDQLDDGNDTIKKGAFKTSLKERPASKVRMLWQHDWEQPIGVWKEMKEDAHGLWVKGQLLLELQRAKEAQLLLKAGALDGMSIGYRTIKAQRDERTNVRTLLEVELWEVSLVTFPMNDAARVTDAKGFWSERQIEEFLRDAGLSKQFAKNVVLHGAKRAAEMSAPRRDADAGMKEVADLLAKATAMMKG